MKWLLPGNWGFSCAPELSHKLLASLANGHSYHAYGEGEFLEWQEHGSSAASCDMGKARLASQEVKVPIAVPVSNRARTDLSSILKL